MAVKFIFVAAYAGCERKAACVALGRYRLAVRYNASEMMQQGEQRLRDVLVEEGALVDRHGVSVEHILPCLVF